MRPIQKVTRTDDTDDRRAQAAKEKDDRRCRYCGVRIMFTTSTEYCVSCVSGE